MSSIYALALSVSQGARGMTTSAYLHYRTDFESVQLRITWPELEAREPGLSAAEWLQAVLSKLVEDFDVHDVEEASIERTTEAGQAHCG